MARRKVHTLDSTGTVEVFTSTVNDTEVFEIGFLGAILDGRETHLLTSIIARILDEDPNPGYVAFYGAPPSPPLISIDESAFARGRKTTTATLARFEQRILPDVLPTLWRNRGTNETLVFVFGGGVDQVRAAFQLWKDDLESNIDNELAFLPSVRLVVSRGWDGLSARFLCKRMSTASFVSLVESVGVPAQVIVHGRD